SPANKIRTRQKNQVAARKIKRRDADFSANCAEILQKISALQKNHALSPRPSWWRKFVHQLRLSSLCVFARGTTKHTKHTKEGGPCGHPTCSFVILTGEIFARRKEK